MPSNFFSSFEAEHNVIAIIGAGPVGMLAALELARHGKPSILLGPKTDPHDLRTTALMMPAIALLEKNQVWQQLKSQSAALSTMQIVDGTSRLVRSAPVRFKAAEVGEEAFGYNIPNLALNKALECAVDDTPLIKRILTNAEHFEHHDNGVSIRLADEQTVDAALVVAGDGKNSAARSAASIKTYQWQYPQTAVVLSFSHALPHYNVSTEFHTEKGPFTQVPLPGQRSSLVWVTDPDDAKRLLALGPQKLGQEVEHKMQSLLGEVKVETMPQSWPLSGSVPKTFAANRTILIGEAAHVFPPIGAQGLNLGARDALALSTAVMESPSDYGAYSVMAAYNRYRRPDIWARTGAVDGLNRILLSNFLPAQFARSLGLEFLRRFSPLRGFFMREGMHPGNGLRALKNFLLPNR